MKFTLTIDMGNAAFDEDPAGEVVRILRDAADALATDKRHVNAGLDIGGTCHDLNGNRVGHFSITGRRRQP